MSRFFSRGYHYDSATSSEEEEFMSSSEDDLVASSSSNDEVESEDSFFNDSESDFGETDDDDSDSKPYGPDWFKKPQFRKGGATGASRFLKGNDSGSDNSDGEESKKVVRSAKDKLLDEMTASYSKIDAADLTQDWVTILAEFENINRLVVKAQQQNFGTPNVFVRVLAQVEDLVNANAQANIKHKVAAKAFNTVRQRLRKAARENEELLAKFREDPASFEKEANADVQTNDMDVPVLGRRNADGEHVKVAHSDFYSALRMVIESRGKKGTDIQAQIRTMEELVDIAQTPYESIIVYLNLIPIRFDATSNLTYQPLDQWKAIHANVSDLLTTLEANIDSYHVTEIAPRNEFIEEEPQPNENGIREILGSVFSFVERLDDEFNKFLLHTDPHWSDYFERLKYEQVIYNLIVRAQLYLEKVLLERVQPDHVGKYMARVFIRRLNHIYYKKAKHVAIIESNAWKSLPNDCSKIIKYSSDPEYTSNLIDRLCTHVAASPDHLLKKRAILYHIYYFALNNEFTKAKEMLVQSSVRNSINSLDPSIQILFNRVIVQLGIAAFKLCLVEDCHEILNEVSTAPHLRDILGQQSLLRASSNVGNNNNTLLSTDQVCLPFHQHINLDFIDSVYMTCSLLIEIPHMAAYYSGVKVRRLPFSQKSIRRALEYYEKSNFRGPPETMRDHMVHAAKAMQKGNWAQCIQYLKSLSTWSLLGENADEVFMKLSERIQIESLKTYIFTYKRFYSKLSVPKLSDFFNLPQEQVVNVIESMCESFNIKGTLNETKEMLIFEKGDEITKLEEAVIKLKKDMKHRSDRLNNNIVQR
ncbi:HFR120Wp [Eremothecium sinecaudum]|uniref:Eukaryotic translation initiation factor 3 subunit C n=1 Tax=Eremothecium sinecaudum TaxID=45286 RepID=A0A109UZU7_9SACH|nr:HFR120Wp [Eremothecium sinecaudum]AMD21975.1 HFR120Wp [Eremothecium sinecaudum]